jgi:NitT/TauT family transport system permease protein
MSWQIIYFTASIGLFLTLWEILPIIVGSLNVKQFIARPSSVFYELLLLLQGYAPIGANSYFHIIHSFRRLLSGVMLGSVVGLVVGIVIGLRREAEDFFESWNWVFATIPAVMWSYIFILVTGANEVTAIGVLAAITYPQMAFFASRGVKAVRSDLVEMGRAFNAKLPLLLREVYMPQILPYVFSGLRYSLAVGIKILAIAELVGLSNGIGFMIQYFWTQRLIAPLLAWGSLLVFLGLFFEFFVFRGLEGWLLKWARIA